MTHDVLIALSKNFRTILDAVLVYLLIYQLLVWTKNSATFNLVKGLIIVAIITFFSSVLGLTTLGWLLGKFATVLTFFILIIFQPELRRILEKIGKGELFGASRSSYGDHQSAVLIKQLLLAVDLMSKKKIGALIALEITSNLDEFIESGILIKARLSSDLLVSLFWPNTPTHDGAVVIRDDKIFAAGCLLPLTASKITDRRLGTRHRAALGLSEISDAVIIVVSEETGTISLTESGNITRFLTKESLETRLFNLYNETKEAKQSSGLSKIFNRTKESGPHA